MTKQSKTYVGVNLADNGQRRRVFRSATEPTRDSHGQIFIYVIGPFRTVDAACIMAHFGQNNPHLQHVSDAERLAKLKPDMAAEARQAAERY